MYSYGLVASAVTKGTSALRSASRLSRFGGATTALALLVTGVGMAVDLHSTSAAPSAETSISDPSLRVVGSLSGLGFATRFSDDLDGAVAALSALKASEVADLWRDLPRDFRSTLVTQRPEPIGNLPGVTYSDRSAANAARLPGLERQAEADLQRALQRNRAAGADAQSELLAAHAADRLEAVRILVDRYASGRVVTADVPQYLIELDATVVGPPLAAVAVGNLDSAVFASFFVPGMNSSVLELPDYIRGVERMQQASDDSAAVLWLGYESPGPVDTVSTEHAEAGSKRFASALAGYDAVRDAAHSLAEVTVIGHSYGSTTAALALAKGNYGVSSFVMIGSAGVPSTLAITDLHVRKDRVYVSQARGDALADSGRFWSGRANPADPAWGAQFFGSDGTTLADGTVLAAVKAHDAVGASNKSDHDKYLGDGTESLYDIRKIITGQCHDVTPDSRFISRDGPILADGADTIP
ncbi:alpha/beta hydrolase [Mycetocola zhadangensis]|uniref:alpha/beta hydrolase n=1 Tax=Mycetocola zhadangensis TaxID=1164595 RepID=UPI003A4D4ADC